MVSNEHPRTLTSRSDIRRILDSCKHLKQFKQVHARIISASDFPPQEVTFHLSKLSSLCATLQPCKGTALAYAKTIFYRLPRPPISLWNSIIRGDSMSKIPSKAVLLYKALISTGQKPNGYTFPFLLRACKSLPIYQNGLLVHTHVIKFGLESEPHTQSSLIHFYGCRRDLVSAKRVFDTACYDDVVSCNAVMDACIKCEDLGLAQLVFDKMLYRDTISWNTMINGYGIIGELEKAESLFDEMPKRNVITWNTMLSVYVNCGEVNVAKNLFNSLPYRDVVSWNVMLACYARWGKSCEALSLFREMMKYHIKPTEATFVSLLSACSHLGSLDHGIQIHRCIKEHDIDMNSVMYTAVVDMYARCGHISKAFRIFSSMDDKDILAWNTVIAGMAMHGRGQEALKLFKKMQEEGTKPNDMTFVALLNACSHSGMVEEGRRILAHMENTYGISPKVDHYSCVTDLLARSGHLEEAFNLVSSMPVEPNASVWGALVGGCRIHASKTVGQSVVNHLMELQPQNSGRYTLFSNIYSAAKRWDEASKVRNLMKSKKIKKVPGASVIELDGIMHRFLAGDRSHPESDLIYEKLSEILSSIKTSAGYIPDTEQTLIDVEEEEKDHILSMHSEKLAVAFGLIKLTPGNAVIRIIKNLRVCTDCHQFFKLISEIYGREIGLRDRKRFHYFKQGKCSCGEFW